MYFTVQSLLTHHQGQVDEVIVVDNCPASAESPHLRNYCETVGAKYVELTSPVGTAPPRNAVFAHATGDVVLCVDSHVLLLPGALAAVRDFYRRAPDSPDLIQGPLLMDNLKGVCTHFNDVWRGGMWGTWGLAWSCMCEELRFSPVDVNGRCEYRELVTQKVVSECDICNHKLPPLAWPAHEMGLSAADFRPAVMYGSPFEIPAQGLGVFGCRRDSWLGFNPDFRGFGGEEWYIHLKYKQAGRKTLCLPGLTWVHRFSRPQGTPYPLYAYHKVRNYVIGHRELGLDLEPIKSHFVPGQLIPEHWEAALTGVELPPAQPTACRSCGAEMGTLSQWFEKAKGTPSDINEHCDTLAALAAQCTAIVDCGMRFDVSSVALAHGAALNTRLATLYVVSEKEPAEVPNLKRLTGATRARVEYVQGDSLTADVPECDLLFLDTIHTGERLAAELERLAPKVRRYIVRHDTVIFGGQLMPAVRAFVRGNPEWTVVRHDRNNNGLLILSRDPRDKKQVPGIIEKATTFTGALFRHLTGGLEKTDAKRVELRLLECDVCPSRNGDACGECGCPVAKKAAWANEECPLGKWV